VTLTKDKTVAEKAVVNASLGHMVIKGRQKIVSDDDDVTSCEAVYDSRSGNRKDAFANFQLHGAATISAVVDTDRISCCDS